MHVRDMKKTFMLTLEQDTREFLVTDLPCEKWGPKPPKFEQVIARTLQPSAPRGGWPGTPVVIREWKVLDKGPNSIVYRRADDEEIFALERVLGEWDNFDIIFHESLGHVTTPRITVPR